MDADLQIAPVLSRSVFGLDLLLINILFHIAKLPIPYINYLFLFSLYCIHIIGNICSSRGGFHKHSN